MTFIICNKATVYGFKDELHEVYLVTVKTVLLRLNFHRKKAAEFAELKHNP